MLKLINILEEKMAKHKKEEYCTSYEKANDIFLIDAETGFELAYDAGYYGALEEILKEANNIITTGIQESKATTRDTLFLRVAYANTDYRNTLLHLKEIMENLMNGEEECDDSLIEYIYTRLCETLDKQAVEKQA